MTNADDCILGAKHGEQIRTLFITTETMAKDIKEMKERLLARPTWVITVIIGFLSTLAFSALTFSFTVVHFIMTK